MAQVETTESRPNGWHLNPFREIEQTFLNIYDSIRLFNGSVESLVEDIKFISESHTKFCKEIVDFSQTMAAAVNRATTAVRRLAVLAAIVFCFAGIVLGLGITLVLYR